MSKKKKVKTHKRRKNFHNSTNNETKSLNDAHAKNKDDQHKKEVTQETKITKLHSDSSKTITPPIQTGNSKTESVIKSFNNSIISNEDNKLKLTNSKAATNENQNKIIEQNNKSENSHVSSAQSNMNDSDKKVCINSQAPDSNDKQTEVSKDLVNIRDKKLNLPKTKDLLVISNPPSSSTDPNFTTTKPPPNSNAKDRKFSYDLDRNSLMKLKKKQSHPSEISNIDSNFIPSTHHTKSSSISVPSDSELKLLNIASIERIVIKPIASNRSKHELATGYGFNEEQILVFEVTFKILDKDANGFITLQEIREIMNSLGYWPSEENIREKIRDIDSDNSGTVDFEEFICMMSTFRKVKTPVELECELKEVFEIFDKNQDGFIDRHELKDVLTKLGENISEDEVKDMIKEADLDGDDKVSFTEFRSILYDNKPPAR